MTEGKQFLIVIDDHAFRGAAFAASLTAHPDLLAAEVLYCGPLRFDDGRLLEALRDDRGASLVFNIGGRSIADPQVIEVLRHLKAQIGPGPLIVLADEVDHDGLAVAMTMGLSGVVPTSLPCDVCLAAIRFITVGGQYFPHAIHATSVPRAAEPVPYTAPPVAAPPELPPAPEPARCVIEAGADDEDMTPIEVRVGNSVSQLTPRQLEVMHLLERGLSNKAIGQELDLSESTIKLHVRHLLRKLKVSNRTQIALLASSVQVRAETEASAAPTHRSAQGLPPQMHRDPVTPFAKPQARFRDPGRDGAIPPRPADTAMAAGRW